MDSFKVFARCRPLNDLQINYGASRKAVSIVDETKICLHDGSTKQHIFQLDGVFDQNNNNKQIFQHSIIPLIDNVLAGINSTVFAYGITGAGKSFTMFGKNKKNQFGQYDHSLTSQLTGIIPFTFHYIFSNCQTDQDTRIRISYLQIYNEQVYDLLQETQHNLQLSQDPVQGCVIVQDLTQVELHTYQQAEQLIALGNLRRVIAETKANQVSSRSHAIVMINVERRIQNTDKYYSAKLSLVDLAGSQKQSVHSQTRGIRTFEGSNINRSLLTLGNCINMLSDKKRQNNGNGNQFIPYRDSKLTRLLKDSLGGNTKTVMIACISPSLLCYDETVNTLKYACRANKIQKIVHQNIREVKNAQEYKKQIMNLKKQNQLLKMNLSMSLMLPGLNTGLLEEQLKQKKKKVSAYLEILTKTIEERTLVTASDQNPDFQQAYQSLCRKEDELRVKILMEFENKAEGKIEKGKSTSYKQDCQIINGRKQVQKGVNKQQQQYQKSSSLRYLNSMNSMNSSKSYQNGKQNMMQYKVVLNEEMRDTENYRKQLQQCTNLNDNKQRNFSRVNLQNLRKKVIQDKKQFMNFKQQISQGLLSSQEIQSKAKKLLRLGQQSALRFSEDEFESLQKLAVGQQDLIIQNNDQLVQKIDKLPDKKQNLPDSDLIKNMIDHKGAAQNSRNRHLKRLNRIIELAKGNAQNTNIYLQNLKTHQYSQIQPDSLDSYGLMSQNSSQWDERFLGQNQSYENFYNLDDRIHKNYSAISYPTYKNIYGNQEQMF